MNIVLIITDTQNKSMSETPNLKRLANEGMRFDAAYTACPVCTPARGALFSGMHPQLNGAVCNNIAPSANIPLMGTIFEQNGYRAAYTGKWHLDGTAYFGDGIPGGGFEGDRWYDGKKYAETIGPQDFAAYRASRTSADLRKHDFTVEKIWGHHVADRAVDFLDTVKDEHFVLVCSFDEPHDPFVAPPEYWERIQPEDIPKPENFNASVSDKPELAKIQRKENGEVSWEEHTHNPDVLHWHACNNYIDTEIGRIVDEVVRLHGNDTMIIYTSDHGDQSRAHGLVSKGPMMYQETTNIPFILRMPDSYKHPRGQINNNVVSHVDVLPTILDYAGIEIPESLHGVSLRSTIDDPGRSVHDAVMVNFHRFAVNHDSFGAYYPIRCAVDGRYKLVLNLHDSDELYDLQTDPSEMKNLIIEPSYQKERDRLHDWILMEMDRIRDPYRTWLWANRSWRKARKPFYHHGPNRPKPKGFEFEPRAIEA